MSTSNWTVISGQLQGNISYDLRKVLVTPDYINFELITFSQAWQEFDIVLEYRLNNKEDWRQDALITQTTAKYLRGNRLYGLVASKEGITNLIQWKYSDNNLFYGNALQLRIKALPRVRVFSTAGTYNQISSVYGDSLVNFDGQSRHTCIGINQSGQYMCVGQEVFYVIDSLDVEEMSSSSSTSSESSESSSSTGPCGIGCMIIEDPADPFKVS